MAKRRIVTIKGGELSPLNLRAFRRLLYHYYKGPNNLEVFFTTKDLKCWAEHEYDSRTKTHYITVSMPWCTHNRGQEAIDFEHFLTAGTLIKLKRNDSIWRIMQVVLHELMHAMQCDRNPHSYQQTAAENPDIISSRLKYEFADIEAEAEGWSYMVLNKAMERYKAWENEYQR